MRVRLFTILLNPTLVLVSAGCGSPVVPAAPAPQRATVLPTLNTPVAPVSIEQPINDLAAVPRVPAASLLSLPAQEEAVYHRVSPGETLTSIGRRYGVSVPRLLDANGLRAEDTLRPDQLIYIPKGSF